MAPRLTSWGDVAVHVGRDGDARVSESACAQPLNVISGALTAQSAAFSGNGSPFQD